MTIEQIERLVLERVRAEIARLVDEALERRSGEIRVALDSAAT
jgi:hypothetical protein